MPSGWVRLSSPRDVRRVYEQGKVKGGRLLRLCYLSTDPLSQTRATFVASKKVGGAVKRNRAKRLLREAWRADGRMRLGWDLVFVASAGAADASLMQVRDSVGALITRAMQSVSESDALLARGSDKGISGDFA